MSTLDFIPHSVKRRKVGKPEPQTSTGLSPSKPLIIQPSSESVEATPPMGPPNQKSIKVKQAIKPSWDFAFLVWLALSDYWLWADGDLRRKIETSQGESTVDNEDSMTVDEMELQDKSDEQGYVPLDHLLNKSHVFRLVSNLQPFCDAKELTYVNSLRQFAKGAIDVRFIVDPESSSTRAAVSNGRKRKPQSGYEVRRTDFASLHDSEFSRYSKTRWDSLTIYMENIPIPYAKVPGIGKLITALLSADSISPMKLVQNISFPPHHKDLPDSIPICKGFALITLSSEDNVQTLLDAWPWDSKKRTGLNEDDMTSEKTNVRSPEEKSAQASGLRICTKTRWEELRAEYLLHRQQLVDEVNRYQDEEESRRQKVSLNEGSLSDNKVASGSKRKPPVTAQSQNETEIHPDSPYPTACLVFVRHVHPETNKTTLRTLFSQAWVESDNAIDYIDYSKNTDSCYVRFGTPADAKLFVDYFSSHHISQLSGLDSRGSESPEVRRIVAEIVLGKREEVYWDKIPEKLRRQAVEKTLRVLYGHGPQDSGGAAEEAPQEGEGGGRRKRKRKAKASE